MDKGQQSKRGGRERYCILRLQPVWWRVEFGKIQRDKRANCGIIKRWLELKVAEATQFLPSRPPGTFQPITFAGNSHFARRPVLLRRRSCCATASAAAGTINARVLVSRLAKAGRLAYRDTNVIGDKALDICPLELIKAQPNLSANKFCVSATQ